MVDDQSPSASEGNRYAKYAQPTTPAENRYAKYAKSDSPLSDDAPDVKTDDSFAGGMKRGFLERGTGVDILLNQIGVGGIMPVFTNGKLSFGLPPNEELAKKEEALEAEGKGTGVKGSVAELAGDPLNLLPYGKLGLLARGGIQGLLSGVTAPTTSPDQTLADRGKNAAGSGILSTATAGLLNKAGSLVTKEAAPAGGKLTDPSKLYEAAKNIGLTLTGKEKPEEIWNKIQTAVKDKVGSLANKIDPGASASKVWPVGVNLATSQMYAATRQAGGKLYDTAKQLGANLEAPAEGLVSHVDDIIADMEKDAPFQSANPKFGTALKKFRQLRDDLAGTGEGEANEGPWDRVMRLMGHGEQKAETVKGNQLIELDQALNEHYGRSGSAGKAGGAFAKLQNKVNETIQTMDPKFGAAYQKAKNYWKDNVIHHFEENKELHKFWKPEDYDAFKDMQKGVSLHPNVKSRVDDQLDKIDSWHSLEVLKNQLPPEMYNSLRATKFISLMDKAGIDAKVLSNEKNYALLTKAVGDDPAALQALDAIKTFAEQMEKRGIGNKISPEDLQESDKFLDRSMRTAFSLATRHKLYGLKHAVELLFGSKVTDVKGKLTGLAEDVAKGTPHPEYTPGAIPKAATKLLGTEEGYQAPAQ